MTEKEEMALRYLAANPHCIGKVQDELGPMSLWSANGLQQALEKAKSDERERIAAKITEYEDLIRDLTEALRVLPERNAVLEEVAAEFDNMKVFGDTAASFAIFVRGMKR
jgi:uncharacterized surface protein with fasciclin (FAS1) repeats